MSTKLESYRVSNVDWVATLGLLLLTRIPWMPSYLGIDRVNLAYALEEFDPASHQPQPPGYPLFVVLSRLVDALVQNPHTTFQIISLGVSALSLPVLYALVRRMFSPAAARTAVFLFVLNPAFWFTSLRSPLRPHLALFALLTAYCCWRCFNGEKAYALWGALALGFGSGFRPDLLAYMFPLWILSAWTGTRSAAAVLKGAAVLGLCILAWGIPMLIAAGGPVFYLNLLLGYAADQSKGGAIGFGLSWRPWLHQLSRLVTWNGLAVVGWLWALPLYLRAENRIRLRSSQAGFIAAWVVPGLLVQAFTHVETPGQTLFSIPAFCVLGGHVLHFSMQKLSGRRWLPAEELAIGAVLVFNTTVFLNVFTLPSFTERSEVSTISRAWLSVRDAILYSAFETSRDQLRWIDEIAQTSLSEIQSFTPQDRPNVIVSAVGGEDEFNFLNWRIASYYLSERDIWVLIDDETPDITGSWTRLVRGRQTVERRGEDGLRIPVPAGGRILWLMEQDTPFVRELSQIFQVQRGRYVFFIDLKPQAGPFRIGSFKFVPM